MKRILLAVLLLCPWIAQAQPYQAGDFYLGQTVRCPWNTHKPSTGSAVVRSAAGTAAAYPDNGAGNGFNTTELTAGVTDIVGTGTFDTDKTGAQTITVDTSNAAYAAGKDYAVMTENSQIIDTGTVTLYDFVCAFSIENRAGTLGRTTARLKATNAGSTTTSVVLQNASPDTVTATNEWITQILWNKTQGWKACITATVNGSPDSFTIFPAQPLVADNDVVWVLNDGPCYPVVQPNVDSNNNVIVGGWGSAAAAQDLTNATTFFHGGGASSSTDVVSLGANAASAKNNSLAKIVEPNNNITGSCALAIVLAHAAGRYNSTSATAPFTTTFFDPSGTTQRIVGTVTTTSLGSVSITCPP